MRRLILALALALLALVQLDAALERAARRRRLRESEFVPIGAAAGAAAGRVARIEAAPPRAAKPWRYLLKEGRWRSADYRGAYLQEDRVRAVLAAVFSVPGTRVAGRARDDAYYGLDDARALRLAFLDEKGRPVLRLRAGRTVPGGAGGIYMRAEEAPGIRLVEASLAEHFARSAPRLPPLVDPSVIPRSVGIESVAKVRFDRPGFGLRRIERRPRPPEDRRPGSEWWGSFEGNSERYNEFIVADYVRFLGSLPYEELLDASAPAARGFSANLGRIALEGDDGRSAILELGGDPRRKLVFARCSETRQVFRLSWEIARVLYPGRAALLTPPRPDQLFPSALPPGFSFPDQSVPPGLTLPPGIRLRSEP